MAETTKRASKTRKRASERTRGITVVAVMTVVLGLALLFGREVLTTKPSSPAVQSLAAAQKEGPDNAARTGSILFMPHFGSDCRQYFFNNVTGRFSDNGTVDCDRAAYRPAVSPPKKWSAARVNVISSGFRER